MKFPNLPAASPLTGSEVVPVTQGGVDVRTTAQAIANTADVQQVAFSDSGFAATNVKDAIVEAAESSGSPTADDVSYDNTESGLAAIDVQSAIDELAAAPPGSGDVTGPVSSVDNTLPRFDGTTGKTLQGSGVSVTDNNEISGYRGHINAQSGTTYTLQASDSGKIVECTNNSAITVTLPNSLAVGFCCTIVQCGAGQVTLSAASGASLRNRQSHTKTAGQWSGATVYVRTNSGGSAAEYVLNGDTAA